MFWNSIGPEMLGELLKSGIILLIWDIICVLRRRMNRNRNRRMFNAYNKGNFRNNVNNRGFNWSKNNNYQNGVRNVNIINRNRNRFYYN